DILRSLIRIASGRAWGADECEAQRVVVWFIRSVLTVGQNRRAILTAHIREIDPLMGRHFKLLRLRRWPLDSAGVPVIGCHHICRRKRESRLEVRLPCLPVDYVSKFHVLSTIACGETDSSNKVRTCGLPFDFDGHTGR